MNVRDLIHRRLASQFLLRPGHGLATDVVRALGAVQSQDYAGAKWALGQRVAAATDASIDRLFDAGLILRTHVLRPTWHFVLPEDIRWMLALTAPRISAAMASYNRKFGLTPAVFRRCNDTVARALEGGRHLTRSELRAALARAGIHAAPQPLGHIMMQTELDGVTCSGARRGKQFTYALFDERVPGSGGRDRDESLADLTLRYFRTRGPATIADMSWWAGLTQADVKRGLEIAGAGGGLRKVEIGGRPYWTTVDQRTPRARPTAHLLPNYDEFFIGLRDRSAVAGRVGGKALVTGGDALTAHVVFLDGQVVGGWRRILDGPTVVISLQLIARITREERARIERQAQRIARFLGTTVVTRDRVVPRR